MDVPPISKCIMYIFCFKRFIPQRSLTNRAQIIPFLKWEFNIKIFMSKLKKPLLPIIFKSISILNPQILKINLATDDKFQTVRWEENYQVVQRPSLSFNEYYFLKSFGYLLHTSQNKNDPDFKLPWVSVFTPCGGKKSAFICLSQSL